MSENKAEQMDMIGLVLRELVPRPFDDHPTSRICTISPKGNRGAFYGDGGRTVKVMDLTERNVPVKTIRFSKWISPRKKDVAVECAVASDTETSNSLYVCSVQYFDENTLGIVTVDQFLHVYSIESDVMEEWEIPWHKQWADDDVCEGKLTCLPDKTRVIISSIETRSSRTRLSDYVFKLFSMVEKTGTDRKRLTQLKAFTSSWDDLDRIFRIISLGDTVVLNHDRISLVFWDTRTGHTVERSDLLDDEEEWDGYVDDNNHVIMFTGSHLTGFLGWMEVDYDKEKVMTTTILKPDIRRKRIVDPFLNNRDPRVEISRLVRKPDGQFWDRMPDEIVATVCTIEGLRTVTISQIVSDPSGELRALANKKYLFFESFMDNVYLGQSLLGPGMDGFGPNGYIMGSESGRCFIMDFVTRDRDKLLAYVKGIHRHRLIKHVPVEIWKRISRFLFLSSFFMPYPANCAS